MEKRLYAGAKIEVCAKVGCDTMIGDFSGEELPNGGIVGERRGSTKNPSGDRGEPSLKLFIATVTWQTSKFVLTEI